MRTYRPALVTDAQALLDMVKGQRMKLKGLPSITFVAEEDGKLLAALGLDWSQQQVVAGPLVMAKEAKKKKYVILRLVETMERFIIKAGVPSYIFGTPLGNTRFNRLAQHLGLQPFSVKDGRNWYRREVSHG